MQAKLEAKVKDTYKMGPVAAFSGHEFVRDEWRPVPIGFEEAARKHPLLDVQEVLVESHTAGEAVLIADPESPIPGVTTETAEPELEAEEPKKKARRSAKKED